ncbi:3-deoxy-D-manno-octulosonic acid kinase [Alteromonas gilva]|uniref:3-deoxy-D-manno-octulosonic acid kinase n=1 Tax=Alteromonas gilva TaxID=2987522 RepID=A0ABT5L4Q2_9ALTE|nr:3-deoxy-D-manno-octulosonic acid kinase [Alteromonas gilva]MDC8831838.1 3-deoxy-D-manno-octulosonic acid kinase [Alteromonas gilva]
MQAIETFQSGRHSLLRCPSVCRALGIQLPPVEWLQSSYWQQQQHATAASGRGQAVLIASPAPMVLRDYCRGGLVRHIARRRFIYSGLANCRPFRELQLLNTLRSAGLPVPRGIAGRVSRYGMTYEASILMERIPNSREVHEHLCQDALAPSDWQRMGALIRQLHDHGVYHHDLNIHNIMLDTNNRFWLIDFDKCGYKNGQQWKAANLARLQRSLRKEKAVHSNYAFDDSHWQRLLTGYWA